MCTQMPVDAVARLLGMSDDRIKRVLDRHVNAGGRLGELLGRAERSARKGQRFLTLFCDLNARRLLFARLRTMAPT